MQDTSGTVRSRSTRFIAWAGNLLATTQSPEILWHLEVYDRARRPRLPCAIARINVALVCVLLAACSSKQEDKDSHVSPGQPVRVDGSSTVYLVSKAIAEELQKAGTTTATVNESGTTAGFKKFCAGEIDVSGASRSIETSEIETCKAAGIDFIELPIGYDGLAVVVSTKNTSVDHLTVDELKKMWSPEATGTITTWKQVRDSFPDHPLHLFGPGGDSGTFDYFTQAIVGKQRASRTDYKSSEDDMVLVRDVGDDENALGYFGYAYVVRNKDTIKAVAIDNGVKDDGDGPIAPSPDTVRNGTYQPLSRPIFIYVSMNALKRPEVERFVTFYLQAARELSAEVGYVALPLHTDQLAKERFKARRTGTMFGGGAPTIGVTMEKLLDVETK